mgnify:CR=1 FL=1
MMFFYIYGRAFSVLKDKKVNVKLLALTWLGALLVSAAGYLCGAVPGLALAIGILFEVSLAMILWRGFRGEEINVKQLFESFRDWATIKRLLLGMGWRYLWVSLWGLIPGAGIVFGTIKRYEYRLVPYILMNQPEVAPTEAIKISSEKTQGYKGQMFLADLVAIAGVFVPLAILGVLSIIPFIGAFFAILLYLVLVVVCAILPVFLGLVRAAFYEEIENPTLVTRSATGVPVAQPAPQNTPWQPLEPWQPAAAETPVENAVSPAENAVPPAENAAPPAAAPAVPAAPQEFCPYCGKPLPPNSQFCTFCGHKL